MAYEKATTLKEINDMADKLLNEGKQEEIKKLAKEKGLDEFLAAAFIGGEIPLLCPDAFTGAVGKLDVELKKLSGEQKKLGWMISQYLKEQAMENETLAVRIMEKKDALKKVCDKAYDEAKRTRSGNYAYVPDGEICLMAKAYYLD